MYGRQIKREAYFENIFESIVEHLWHAEHCVKICVAWITGERLNHILSVLKGRGVVIEIILDDNSSNRSTIDLLTHFGEVFPVRNWTGSFMHNKFCIIDNQILITGSFNWTTNADNSLENALMIAGDYQLIKDYLHEFEDLKDYSRSRAMSRPITPRHEDGSICCSLTFNVGVFGYQDYTNGTQKIVIWNVCNSHRAARPIRLLVVRDDFDIEKDESEYNFFDRPINSREEMLALFQQERKERNTTRSFFSKEMESEIHAYGFVRAIPQPFKHEAERDEEFHLDLEWRHPYWRKIIPSKLFYDSGDIWKIIRSHRPNGTDVLRIDDNF